MMLLALTSGIINVGLSVFVLWHLSNIFRYGEFTIFESNPLILLAETIATIAFLAFGIYLFIYFYRRSIREHKWKIVPHEEYVETEPDEEFPGKVERAGYLVSLRDYMVILKEQSKKN
jgi:hypothetical protein